MKQDPKSIGALIRKTRKSLKLTQQDLALSCGTGLRFIIDLEKGKPSCEWAKALTVIQTLGIDICLTPPRSTITMYPKL